MIMWGIVCGALIGWCAADFASYGLALGAVPGLIAGLTLRSAVRRQIATALAAWSPASEIAPLDSPQRALPVPAPAQQGADLPRLAVATVPDDVPLSPAVAWQDPAPEAGPGPLELAVAAARDWLLGGNTIVRAGLVILFIGLSFLARYAAQHSLFPVELRLALVALTGIALLGVGFSRRVTRPAFALALEGTGVAAIYLTIFAAARLFEVIAPVPAFGLMIVVCALGCALALLQDAQALAVASFLGGFAVPVLLSTGPGSSLVLFSYYTILNLAVLFIAQQRAWRLVNLVGFVATFGVATAWGVLRYEPSQYALAQPFLIAFVLIYIAAALLYARNAAGRLGNVVDSTLLFGPALIGFGLQVGLVRHLAFGSAFSALGFGAVYLALAAFARRRGYAQNRLLGECLIAIGVGFVTVAIPLALGAQWTSSAWALEGAGAFWVGMRQARWMPRLFGLILQLVAACVFLSTLGGVPSPALLDPAGLGAVLIAAPVLAVAWWLRQPLAHSGSAWAESYAAFEAQLGAPVFLLGFACWWLALALEAHRLLPPAITGAAAVPVFAPAIQPLLVMLAYVGSAGIATIIGRRLDWRVATWPGRVTLIPIALTLVAQVLDREHVLFTPDWMLWLVTLGVHYALLRANDAPDDAAPEPTAFQRWVHIGSVWVMTLWFADCLWLGIDPGGLWGTSWASVVMLVSLTLALAALTATAIRGGSRWPLDRYAAAYYWVAAAPLAGLVFAGVLIAGLVDPGRATPLPYVPLLNPLDLALALGIGALLLWRRTVLAAAPAGAGVLAQPGTRAGLALLAFVALNTVWLRIAHHFLAVAWTPEAIASSFIVQTGLAILWTSLALTLMVVAHKRSQRTTWLTGAGLLTLVVAKLLLVDLANRGGGERVVTFMVVGLLMLVVGYFAPLPPAATADGTAEVAA